MKKRFYAVLVLIISLSMFVVVPFILYLLSHVFYYLGDLINIYENFLSNYFEPQYVVAVGATSFVFFAIPLIALFLFFLSLFLESVHDNR